MDIISAVLPPLVGGVIGYITNDLAIRMLFRPFKPVVLGRFRLPLTPGIVPRHQAELAVALGAEVERRFFNADDLEIVFQSDEFTCAVADSVTDLLYTGKTPLYSAMAALASSGDTEKAFSFARDTFCRQIGRALLEVDYAPLAAGVVREILNDKNIGNLKKQMVNSMVESLPDAISDGIRRFIRSEGNGALAPIVDGVVRELTDHSVRSLAKQYFPDRELTREVVCRIYRRFMAGYVRRVVDSIDVGGMITEKVRQMEPAAIEALILSVVSREFRYVVLLGGLIGAVIGTVNIFI
jgi:uncharacterized membrane-anchored protein YjiN (DUF445 family)